MLGDGDKRRVDHQDHGLRGSAAEQQEQEVFGETHMANDITREVMAPHHHPVRGRDRDAARQNGPYAGGHAGPSILLEQFFASHTIYSHGEVG